MNKDILVVIPSYEPDEKLISTCENLVKTGLNNIIVVNDGSSDEYNHYFEQIQTKWNIKVLHHNVNMGKGRALKTAFEYIIKNQTNCIGCVTADSDGQHSPKDILKCIDTLMTNSNSLILGCRDFSLDNIPAKSKFGNELTKKICKAICNIEVSDTQTGLRGIPLAFMKELLSVKGERFEFETYMLIGAKDKYPIKEIEIETIYESRENHKTHFNPFLDSIRIYKIFFSMFLKYIFSSVSSCIVDIVLFSLLCSVLDDIYPYFYILLSTIFARVVSATYNCLVNYKLVFKSSNSLASSIMKYFALASIQMILSASLVSVGVFAIPFVPRVIIKTVTDAFLFFLSYFIQKKYVF